MKWFILAIACWCSTQALAYSSEVDLGSKEIYPGEELILQLADLPIYPDLSYNLECKLQPLNEKSHMVLKSSYNGITLWVSDCTDSATKSVICPLAAQKEIKFGFKGISKNLASSISLKNLDFTQVFKASCIAFPHS